MKILCRSCSVPVLQTAQYWLGILGVRPSHFQTIIVLRRRGASREGRFAYRLSRSFVKYSTMEGRDIIQYLYTDSDFTRLYRATTLAIS